MGKQMTFSSLTISQHCIVLLICCNSPLTRAQSDSDSHTMKKFEETVFQSMLLTLQGGLSIKQNPPLLLPTKGWMLLYMYGKADAMHCK